MNKTISQLLKYALDHKMIEAEDADYCANKLLDLFSESSFEKEDGSYDSLEQIMTDLLDEAVKKGMIEGTITQRDLLDAKIMDIVMPRPGEVIKEFNTRYKENPKAATDWYYDLSIRSNYIHKDRTDKNIKFNKETPYGEIQISINLSKPEKDPKDIAAAKSVKASGYPKCLLCKENVGFAGNANHPARQNHRIIPLDLNGGKYYLQYSPYVYYNEHCIVFNKDHVPMRIDHDTFEHLVAFVNLFPHYTAGSNTDIPIVGGSILTHDHYQGGNHHFPIQDAKIRYATEIDGVTTEFLDWPLSTLRIRDKDAARIIALSDKILEAWKNYEDPELEIIKETDGVRHNAITPILRMKDGEYEMDLVLRNNRTSDEHPDGIFHPHKEHHHVKKENIGLIEVMGLAILPARLKDEVELIKKVLKGNLKVEDDPRLEKHKDWILQLHEKNPDLDNLDGFMEQALADKFVCVLEDAGVYKKGAKGLEGALRFIERLKS